MTERQARTAVRVLAAAFFTLLATMSFARYTTCHQRTFDLALYARLAWGLARGDLREPILGGHFLGEHCALVLWPLGWLGRVLGTVPVLLVAQAGAYASAAFPLARFALRRGGPWLAVAGAAAWLLQPNLGHVIAFEMHPGNLALPALAWGIDAADRHDVRGLGLSIVATLACRDDLGVVAALLAVTAAASASRATPGAEPPGAAEIARVRRGCLALAAAALAYAAVLLLVVQPRYAIANSSLDAHFGGYGHTLPEIARYLAAHPDALARHLLRPERAVYLPKILAPVGLVLPLLAPRWLLPAIPVVALNLVSQFVTTPNLDSHYLTPAVPFLVAAAIAGTARVAERFRLAPRSSALVMLVPVAIAHFVAGGTPLARDFPVAAFVADDATRACHAALGAIPGTASVQAPDALLPHLAERTTVHRAPPPDRGTAYLVLDVTHRARWAHDESLLRTSEEPQTRDFLARPDRQVTLATDELLVLVRGLDPRGGVNARALAGTADARAGTPLCACLSLLSVALDHDALVLELVARAPCPNDLAVRLGEGARPRRVDLLFGGTLSPVHLRRGDRLRSRHLLVATELDAVRAGRFRVGLLRSSGAPPEPTDPVAIDVRLR